MNAPSENEPCSDPIDILDLAREVLVSELSGSAGSRLRIRAPIRPGGSGAMVLSLTPESGAPRIRIDLMASDLVAGASRIAAGSVRISPSSLTVAAGAAEDVTVTVAAPPDARPGVYAGTISATGDETFSVPFQTEVR